MSLSPAAAALATQPDLHRLWQAAHRRVELTGGNLGGASAVLAAPSPAERQAVDRLLGTRSRGRTIRVRLAFLDELLATRADASLAEVVAAAVGPLRDRPRERAAVVAALETMWSGAVRHRAVGRHPTLTEWFDNLRRSGRLRRLDDAERRLTGALDVLANLPSPEPIARARLGAMVLGDSHSLDDDQPEGRLVVSALAHLAGADPPIDTARRRRLWADAGVTLDDLSSSVLTLGLRPLPRGPLTEAAAHWASAGVALPIPLAAVLAEPWEVPPGTPVWACENPTVLMAAAARFGAAGPRSSAWPATRQWRSAACSGRCSPTARTSHTTATSALAAWPSATRSSASSVPAHGASEPPTITKPWPVWGQRYRPAPSAAGCR